MTKREEGCVGLRMRKALGTEALSQHICVEDISFDDQLEFCQVNTQSAGGVSLLRTFEWRLRRTVIIGSGVSGPSMSTSGYSTYRQEAEYIDYTRK